MSPALCAPPRPRPLPPLPRPLLPCLLPSCVTRRRPAFLDSFPSRAFLDLGTSREEGAGPRARDVRHSPNSRG